MTQCLNSTQQKNPCAAIDITLFGKYRFQIISFGFHFVRESRPMRFLWRKNFFRTAIPATLALGIAGCMLAWIPYERESRIISKISSVAGLVEMEQYDPDWVLKSFGPLQVFDRARRVVLRDRAVSEDLLKDIGTMTNLEVLDLHNTCTTDAGLRHLTRLKRLQVLRLEFTDVTDEGLVVLNELPNLQVLHLDKTRITDAGLVNIRNLKELKVLHLNGTRIGDAGLEHLRDLHNLTWLSLDNTCVGDSGLAVIKSFESLHELDLECTRITREGFDDLKGMHHLQSLALFGTQIRRDGRNELRESLPNCHVSPLP